MAAYNRGESGVFFEISRGGKVSEKPERRVRSTSDEMQEIIDRLIPQVQEYFQFLLYEALTEKK